MKIPRASTVANTTLCLTPACLQIASEFEKNLSPDYKTIDPCTNFEELICGGWKASHELRPDQGQISTLNTIDEAVEATLRKIIEGPYPGESSHSNFSPRNLDPPTISLDQQNFDTIQRAYNACMDETAISELGVKPIISLLDELTTTFAPSGDWSATGEYINRIASAWFISASIDSDPRDPDTLIIGIAPSSGIGLGSKAYYNDSDIVSEYRDALTHVFRDVYPTGTNPDDAAKWASSVVDFEVEIAKIMPELAELRAADGEANPTPISDVDALIPQVGIQKIIKLLAPKDYDSAQITVTVPRYFANMSTLLDATPRTTIENYFIWKVIQGWESSVIAKETFTPYRRLRNKLNGREPDAETERWRKCLSYVDDNLGWILSRFFVEKSFSAKDRDFGNEIIARMREVYISKFENLEWMDDSVKAEAVKKIRTIVQKIGYPSESPNITDPSNLRAYYAAVPITASYLNNSLALTKWSVNETWSSLGKPTDRKVWGMTAPTVNAYYNPPLNEIVFPAGIMQPPIFGADFPSYISYGGFGAVAGHEVSHGFDDQGRHYDSKGRNIEWWTNATAAEYIKRAQCFVDQFDSLTVVGAGNKTINIKGNQTLGENIADSAGISASFAAWQQSRKDDGGDANNGLLPGLEGYFKTPEQLFFVAYGNLWCTKSTPAFLTRQVLTDVHSPGAVRIRGTVQNSRGFKEAFGCPVKEPTCELW